MGVRITYVRAIGWTLGMVEIGTERRMNCLQDFVF